MNTHQIAPTAEEYTAVVAYLKEQYKTLVSGGPGMSEFEASIAAQFAHTGKLSRKQVDVILNRAERSTLPGPEIVPAGRYAVSDDNGDPLLVKVWRGKNDPTSIRVYALKGVDVEGEELPTRKMIARIVAVGPAQAARNFGRLTKRCSLCGRKLDIALSRKLHIGPVCGSRFYDESDWGLIKLEASCWLSERGIVPKAPLPRNVDLAALEAQA